MTTNNQPIQEVWTHLSVPRVADLVRCAASSTTNAASSTTAPPAEDPADSLKAWLERYQARLKKQREALSKTPTRLTKGRSADPNIELTLVNESRWFAIQFHRCPSCFHACQLWKLPGLGWIVRCESCKLEFGDEPLSSREDALRVFYAAVRLASL